MHPVVVVARISYLFFLRRDVIARLSKNDAVNSSWILESIKAEFACFQLGIEHGLNLLAEATDLGCLITLEDNVPYFALALAPELGR